MFVIGLTGGIGTGKTEVSNILRDHGAVIINADLVGHDAYKPDTPGWRAVVEAFGEAILAPTGEVDRKKLGPIVFNDPESMKRLNAIMHPRIFEMIAERIAKLSGEGSDVVVVEAALLIEANWTSLADEVWVSTSPQDEVVQRLQNRNMMDEQAIRARIDAQMPQQERINYADVVIDNRGSFAELRRQVDNLWDSRVSAR